MSSAEDKAAHLFTKDFFIVNCIFFLSAAIMAVFFNFQHYLGSLGISAVWFGFLIGADSLASFFLQPVLAVRINMHNSRAWMFIGIFGMAALLLCYTVATGLASLIMVRILHGAAFVCLLSAMTAMLTGYIPPEKSGQAFGLVSIVRLVPYSVVPPLLMSVDRSAADFREVLMYGAFIMALSSIVVFRLKLLPAIQSDRTGHGQQQGIREMIRGGASREVLALFGSTLLLYSSYTIVFFFLKTYGHARGIANPGFFFTIATVVMIGIRLLGGAFFDKANKVGLTTASMTALAVCYGLLFHADGIASFYCLAFLAGLGWGIAMPLFNALIFDVSPPHLRSMNLNFSLVMMQGGFFIGPFLGGILSAHWGYGSLFYFCAFLSLAGAVLIQTCVKKAR